MSFSYDPRKATQCAPPGDYPATIEKAVEGISKSSGNEMLTITFRVYAGNRQLLLDSYVTEAMLWVLQKIAKAIGKIEVFDRGEFFAKDYIGESLTVTLKIETSEKYGEQNRITNYKPKQLGVSGNGVPPVHESAGVPADEQIPF